MSTRALRLSARGLVVLAGIYLVLLIPERDPPRPNSANRRPFLWDHDAFWESLEARFEAARAEERGALAARIAERLATLAKLAERLEGERLTPEDPAFDGIETGVFELAPEVAAAPERSEDYLRAIERIRRGIKRQSETWNMDSGPARERLYRLLYGSRAALEEVLLQAPPESVPALVLPAVAPARVPPSASPSIEVHGVRLESGDILVSRGAAPTSALIARGHDLPGNFSHVALLHVDEHSGVAAVIEAHIEHGVAVANVEQYLRDQKLRILVLRPRPDLPELAADPLLSHRAAAHGLEAARARRIPYDFAMDKDDHSALFCSEVASAAYEEVGIQLWPGHSSISSPGIAAWLAAFGVRNFETQEPSDLEYDPKLSVVAEWRDPETLFQDHVDNAVIDVLLEGAVAGESLEYELAMLPLARGLKAWSVFRNLLGRAGPVPEGMSATAALRNQRFANDHGELRARVLVLADGFAREHGYRPPYWELVHLARAARAGSRKGGKR